MSETVSTPLQASGAPVPWTLAGTVHIGVAMLDPGRERSPDPVRRRSPKSRRQSPEPLVGIPAVPDEGDKVTLFDLEDDGSVLEELSAAVAAQMTVFGYNRLDLIDRVCAVQALDSILSQGHLRDICLSNR